jgi:phosphoserine aminotransferase
MIYAGAQKNLGPSGVTVTIISDELLDRVPANQHTLLDYRNIANNRSMANTPNTWGIYLIGLVCEWLEEQGGVESMAAVNAEKARRLYEALDGSDGFYSGNVDRNARSRMNVTFRLPTDELDDRFCAEAELQGMSGLRGHRSVGGIRASIYNAFPIEGVDALIAFMHAFSAGHR